ncbi:hypothetical protein [Actinoplanes flavus]|uniref:Uncharacterized protein n=1 Tax=Actinoplanes flavus TaxID=2820290 RepID=A0ABS3UDV1_9ACTN|nr:hypothetical protein [Actinoplanes flavus]MBO3736962.1 hypothetical protein [Actinoplanes flavus]
MTALLLGGEMPHWSDGEPAGGPVLRRLAASARGHTLIVGPHEPELIDAVPARQITVLVRGVPDAETLATRYAGRPGVEVCCGSLAKLAAVPAYDTVIALDGLDRAGSTETEDLTWAAGLALLLAVLRPGGRLLLGCANPAGLHRLYAAAAEPGDADWAAPAGDDPTRPVGLDDLRERLRAAGLTPERGYAAHPSPRNPAVLVTDAALADPELAGLLTSALRRAGRPSGPLLADPRPLAPALLRHRLASALAPAWFVAATRPGHPPTPLPDVLLAPAADNPKPAPSATSDDPKPTSSSTPDNPKPTSFATADNPKPAPSATPDEPGTPSARAGHEPGTPSALWRTARGWLPDGADEPLPTGRCLHDVLLSAARRGNLPEMRALLTAWQSGDAAGVDADAILVTGDGGLYPLAAPAGPDAALSRFAGALHDENLADRWPAGLPAAMTGRDPDPVPRPAPETFRELSAAHDRLARELSEARAQIEWYEQSAATMRADLSRAHRVIAVLRATTPGRAATAVLGGVRGGKRLARTVLTRLRSTA